MNDPVRITCRFCNGLGYWMAPVYHNERQPESCSRCRGLGTETVWSVIVNPGLPTQTIVELQPDVL